MEKEDKGLFTKSFRGGGEMRSKILFILIAMVFGISSSILLTPAPSSAAEPIIVGVPTSIYTPFGRDGLKAVNMAVEEINAKGGVSVGSEKRPIKVVVTDTRDGEPTTPVHDALMAYEKLILEQKPHATVIAPFRSETIIASMDLVAKYKVPQLQTIAQTPQFQAKFKTDPEKYKYLFRVTTDAAIDAGYLAGGLDALKADFGLNKVYFIPQDTLWALGFIGVLRKHCEKTGWQEVGYEPYAAGATDFSPGLTKVKEGKAQVIGMVWDVPLGAGIFSKQWAAMKVPAVVVGFVPPMAAPDAWKTVGKDVEYSIQVEFPVGASVPLKKLPKTVEFLDRFQKKYGKVPEAAAVNSSAYDSVYILAAAIERAGNLDPDKLVTALEQTDYRGVSGRLRFNKDHIIVFDSNPEETGVCVVFQWQKGKRVPIYPAFLAEGKVALPPWMKK
jgi:branched-chain amino acid transport system substrate-binding protein